MVEARCVVVLAREHNTVMCIAVAHHKANTITGSGESAVQDGRAHVQGHSYGTAPSYVSQLVRTLHSVDPEVDL